MEASSSSRYIDQYVFRYNHKGLCVKHTVVGLLELGLVGEVRHGEGGDKVMWWCL